MGCCCLGCCCCCFDCCLLPLPLLHVINRRCCIATALSCSVTVTVTPPFKSNTEHRCGVSLSGRCQAIAHLQMSGQRFLESHNQNLKVGLHSFGFAALQGLQQHGGSERLQRAWVAGGCKPGTGQCMSVIAAPSCRLLITHHQMQQYAHLAFCF